MIACFTRKMFVSGVDRGNHILIYIFCNRVIGTFLVIV
jgi:hypothetical protein